MITKESFESAKLQLKSAQEIIKEYNLQNKQTNPACMLGTMVNDCSVIKHTSFKTCSGCGNHKNF